MATLASNVLTLADWAKRRDPKGKTGPIVETLSQTNRVLDDMLYKEGNLPTGERTNIRTGLPAVYYRLMNQGVPKSKSTTAQITENAAELTALSEVDRGIAELESDVSAFRLSESVAFLESMSQKQAETLFYGSAANPEEYVGLANRYSSLSGGNAQNILSAGGAGSDNTSVWLVSWGANTIHGVFPKESKAGISHEDGGIDWAFDSDNNRFKAYIDSYTWKNGLVVKDWRYGVRIPNVDISDLVGQTGTQALSASTAIIKLMVRSIDRLPMAGSNTAFYVNRTVASHLRLAAMDTSNSVVTIEAAVNQFGSNIMELKFLGIPVRIVDQLLETESVVS